MALQDSTFKTAHVLDNEIIKANDFEFAFEQLVENVSKATQMFLESTQDFVINGKVIPAIGMNVSVSPIYGVCKSTGKPFGRTETTDETIGFAGSTSGRIDIIEVQGDWETYDNQQRAFNDPDTDVQTYQYVDTKKLMKPVYRVVEGVEGAGVAPDKDVGWVKLAEVSIRAGATSILATDIHNITADVAGMDNEDWTNEEDITYNIGYISDVNARFRVQHEEDGTHSENSIGAFALDIGTGTNQINGNILPIGGAVTIPSQAAISSTDSIYAVIIKAVNVITTLYNNYLKFGTYGFEGEVQISASDTSDVLDNPLKLSADGLGNATVKIGNSTVLSIDTNGKIHASYNSLSSSDTGYTLVTKAITDALNTAIGNLDTRVTNIENTSDTTIYANNTLSTGTDGRYNLDTVEIIAASTQNVTLSGTQSIDGVTLTDGQFLLIKDQTNAKENGIYQYSSSSVWSRVSNYLSPNALKAKIFSIVKGTQNGKKMFYLPRVNFTDGEAFGTDDILFSEYFGAVLPAAKHVVMRDANGHVKATGATSNDDCLIKSDIANLIGPSLYPVGSIYRNKTNPTDPATLLGFGTWEKITDTFLACASANSYSDTAPKYNGATSGGGTYTLTMANIPSHNHEMAHQHYTNIIHTHTLNDPGHSHWMQGGNAVGGNNEYAQMNVGGQYGGAPYPPVWEWQKAVVATVTGITVNSTGDTWMISTNARYTTNPAVDRNYTGDAGQASPTAISIVPQYQAVYTWYRTA